MERNMLRRIIGATLALLAVPAVSSVSFAQTLPPRVTILVPFAAGGPVDFVARQLAEGLKQKLAIIAIVENKPGANGVLAANMLRQSPADGQMLMVTGQGLMTISPHLTKMEFDPLKDLAAISGLAYSDAALVVSNTVKANDLKEFVELARNASAPLPFAHAGVGNILHLYAERLKSVAKIDFTYVPYKGVQPALQDTAGGFVTGVFAGLVAAVPLIEGKQVKVLGIIGEKRSPLMPEVPTMAEQGYPVNDVSWFALVGPPNFPAEKANAVAKVAAEILSQDSVVSLMAKSALFPWLKDPKELSRYMAEESDRWKILVEQNNIRAE
jgi:tripartite-type tricarboxylate transporter receptor subunit TctC